MGLGNVAKLRPDFSAVENSSALASARSCGGGPQNGPKMGPVLGTPLHANLETCKSWEREARQGRRVGPKTVEHEIRFS